MKRIAGLLAPFPGRAEFAVRVAIACALTTLDVQLFQTPEPALTIYVVFFVIKPDRAASVLISIVMALLVTVIIGLVLLIAMVVIDAPLWRVCTIALLSFCLLFAASASKLKPVGATTALIAGYALDALGMVHSGEVATRALLYAWLFVIIPCGISIAVNLLAGPPPRRLVERAIAARLKLAAALLRRADENTRKAFAECLLDGQGEIPAWLKLAGAEHTSPRADLAALAQAARATCALLALTGTVVPIWGADLSGVRAELAACFDGMAAILERGGIPFDIALAPARAADIPAVDIAGLAAIRDVLANFAVAPALEGGTPAKSGFFVPDAFTNPVHTQYALKATAAAMFCYIVYLLLDWPGIHTCFITCFIVSLGTTAETMEKLTLRIAGCLAGAALGIAAIVFVMPSVTSIGVLMAVVGAAAFVSGWIAAGSPRISYVGFQLAFAFFLCVVQGSGPQFDMTIARDRVIGILFGNLAVAVIFTQIWPTTVAARIDPALAALLRKLAGVARESVGWKRWALIAEAQGAQGAVATDVALTRFEPSSSRPAAGWSECRERILGAIGACQGPLLLAGGDPPANAAAAKELDRLAGALDGHGPAPGPAGNDRPAQGPSPFPDRPDELVRLALSRLEHAIAYADQGGRERNADNAAA